MISLTSFLPEVYLEAPECPELVALNALRNALREFCEESKLWAETLDPISLEANTAGYDVDLPAETEIAWVLSAKYNGKPVTKIYTRREMDEEFGNWETITGDGVVALIPGFRAVQAYPIPLTAAADALVLHAALMPSTAATTCADELYQYHESIAAGAIARLKAVPNKPWTDRESVAFYKDLFEQGKSRASVQAESGRAKRTLRTQRWGRA